jgi:hypothetical protein
MNFARVNIELKKSFDFSSFVVLEGILPVCKTNSFCSLSGDPHLVNDHLVDDHILQLQLATGIRQLPVNQVQVPIIHALYTWGYQLPVI